MIVFPNAKINLGLHIISKREDGYHNLETVFYPLPFCDVLEIIQQSDFSSQSPVDNQQSEVRNRKSDVFEFTITGLSVNGNADDNLCVKAYHLLKKDFTSIPGVRMHLHKVIPIGAGLGGGSADAAFSLLLFNKKFQLNLSANQLINYALQLGSDCPFFIINKPCFAQQRGEVLHEISIDLLDYKIIIVNPGIHINTGWAFSKIIPRTPDKHIAEIIQQPISTWKDELKNDFEEPVMKQYPELKTIKEKLYSLGAIYAAMSGSGSTFFGIFHAAVEIAPLSFPVNYFIKEIIFQ